MNHEDLLQQAKAFTKDAGYVSVSSLQRKFMIGYQQARQLTDTLIQQGFCEAKFTPQYGYRIYKQGDKTTMSKIKFEPWIGSKYFTNNRFGLRVLVLGESHYGDPADYRPEFTTEIVRLLAQENRHAFFTKVSSVLLGLESGKLDDYTRGEIWEHIAFYNYIQDYVGTQARISPTSELWTAAQQPFLYMITKLSPQVILVLGKALGSHIPKLPDHIQVRQIVHPSSSHFTYKEANPLFSRAIQQAKIKV